MISRVSVLYTLYSSMSRGIATHCCLPRELLSDCSKKGQFNGHHSRGEDSVGLLSSMNRFLRTTLDQWHTPVECKLGCHQIERASTTHCIHSLVYSLTYWLLSNNYLNLINITLSFQG